MGRVEFIPHIAPAILCIYFPPSKKGSSDGTASCRSMVSLAQMAMPGFPCVVGVSAAHRWGRGLFIWRY